MKVWLNQIGLFVLLSNLAMFLFVVGVSPIHHLVINVVIVVAIVLVNGVSGLLKKLFDNKFVWIYLVLALLPVIYWVFGYPMTASAKRIFVQYTAGLVVVIGVVSIVTSISIHKVVNVFMLVFTLACVSLLLEAFIGFDYQQHKGRAAGLYLNPNTAAEALLFIALIIVRYNQKITSRVGLFFLFATALALSVGVTFSRSGILALIVLLVFGYIVWMTSFRRYRRFVNYAFILIPVIASFVLTNRTPLKIKVTPNVQKRMDALLEPSKMVTNIDGDKRRKEDARVAIFKVNWANFKENPIFGNGPGFSATAFRKEKEDGTVLVQGAHNFPLALMVDYGLLGLFVFIAINVLGLRLFLSDKREWAFFIGFAFLFNFFSMFTHNMLTFIPVLTIITLFFTQKELKQ